MARVFVSYATRDIERAVDIADWLRECGHDVFLDQDLQGGIPVGDEWEFRLYERLRWADAVVCVLTTEYLTSVWCSAELGIARSRGCRVLPMLAEAGVVHPLLASVQYADATTEPAAARAALTEALRRIDAVGGMGWPDGRCPFPGLRPYDPTLRRVFFGRTADIEGLAGILLSPAEQSDGAVLVVVGPSGCGKSSLVRAGLVPAIADAPSWCVLRPFLPSTDPFAGLARELAAAGREVGFEWTVPTVRGRLEAGALSELADELLFAGSGVRRTRLLIVVDQFEELFTQVAADTRAAFARLLGAAPFGPIQVVATLRPEFLDRMLLDPDLAALRTRLYPLRPLRREALRAVVEEPAQLAGIRVSADLVDRLVADTDNGDALPLLAFTLAELAEGVDRGGELSAVAYDRVGGVSGALIRQAEAALVSAVAATGRSPAQVIAGLLLLVTVDEDGHPTRRQVSRDGLPAPVAVELEAFVTRRLLVTDTVDAQPVVAVAHEAFLSAWPPLASAIDNSATALRARRVVEQAANAWAVDHRVSRLWERGQLASALADTGACLRDGTVTTRRVELSSTARDFLRASVRRDRFRRGRATITLSVFLALALIAATIAFVQRHSAQTQERLATVRKLVAQADALRETDPRTALLLGIAADHIQSDGETRASLVDTLTSSRYLGALDHRASVHAAAFSPDSRLLATGIGYRVSEGEDKAVVLWDVSDPRQPRQLGASSTELNKKVNAVAFSPTGGVLATGSVDGTVRLWDITDPRRLTQFGQPLTGQQALAGFVEFSPDGRTLTTAGADNTIVRWDIVDPAHPRLAGPPLSTGSLAIAGIECGDHSLDGRFLAAGRSDGTVVLWDLGDHARPSVLGVPGEPVSDVAFSPDGQTLAVDRSDRTVTLWDLADPTRPSQLSRSISSQGGGETSVVFSPDGHVLAADDVDDHIVLWDVADRTRPRVIGRPLAAHRGSIASLAYAPNGRTMVSGGLDQTAVLWDMSGPATPVPFGTAAAEPGLTDPDVTGEPHNAAFAPTGHILAIGSGNQVTLWDTTDPARPAQIGQSLDGHAQVVQSVAFSNKGNLLAARSPDRVVVWDVADPNRPHQLGKPIDVIPGLSNLLAFSPDGRILFIGTAAFDLMLWDLTDPAFPRPIPNTLPKNVVDPAFIAFSGDQRTLITASAHDDVRFWDAADLSDLKQIPAPALNQAHTRGPVTFSSDGKILATSTSDNKIILWGAADLANPRQIGEPIRGHTNYITTLSFSHDGQTLASASRDHTVILWDLSNPNHPRPLNELLIDRDHPDTVSVATFSRDNRMLVLAGWITRNKSEFQTASLWDLASQNDLRHNPVARACAITNGGLTPEEWSRVILNIGYEETCPPS